MDAYEEVEFQEEPYDRYPFQVNDQETTRAVIEQQTRGYATAHHSGAIMMSTTASNDDDEVAGGKDNYNTTRDSEPSPTSGTTEDYCDVCFCSNFTDMAVQEQDGELLAELEELREDFEAEKSKRTAYAAQNESLKAELSQTKQALQHHRDALQRLAAASETAFKEFEQLKGSYVQEVVCRDKAEKYAATLFAEREAARRQSTMLLMNVAGDRKLMEAMMEVETLTTRVEQQKAAHERQVKELLEEMESLRNREEMESLEEENRQLGEQILALQAQTTAQHTEYMTLLSQYENLEKRLEEATRPPPPPPPPPLPPTGKLSKMFGGKKAKKAMIKQSMESKGTAVTQGYSQALEEMMKRIKAGTQLRSAPAVARPSRQPVNSEDASDGSAMTELKHILGRMKKMPLEVGSAASQATSTTEVNSELANALKKRNKLMAIDDNESKQETSKQLESPEPKAQPQSPEEITVTSRDSGTADYKEDQAKPVPRRRRVPNNSSSIGSSGHRLLEEER